MGVSKWLVESPFKFIYGEMLINLHADAVLNAIGILVALFKNFLQYALAIGRYVYLKL